MGTTKGQRRKTARRAFEKKVTKERRSRRVAGKDFKPTTWYQNRAYSESEFTRVLDRFWFREGGGPKRGKSFWKGFTRMFK